LLPARKLRLFAVECCRLLLPFISDPHSRKALRIAERYAEGQATAAKLRFAWEDARRAAGTSRRHRRHQEATLQDDALWVVTLVVEENFTGLVWLGGCVNRALARAQQAGLTAAAPIDEVRLVRCIFGNLFRPAAIDAAWLAWNNGTIPTLAQAIYDHHRFTDLPILADALEEAGCTSHDILNHYRQAGVHARGCWVVDVVLGKG
jgi:hypothetical protein